MILYNWYTGSPLQDAVKESSIRLYIGLLVSVQYFVCIFEATLCSPIRWRASATAFHVGSLAVRSQQLSTSCLQRSLPSPRKSWSITRSSWSSSPNLTPSKCQFTTESSAFESSFSVGVAGGGEGEKTRSHTRAVRILNALMTLFLAHVKGRAYT